MNQCLLSEHLQDMKRPRPALTGKADLVSGSTVAHSAASSPWSQTLCHPAGNPWTRQGKRCFDQGQTTSELQPDSLGSGNTALSALPLPDTFQLPWACCVTQKDRDRKDFPRPPGQPFSSCRWCLQ